MHAEQNVLTERVYGELRSYCRHKYGVDFHVSVDARLCSALSMKSHRKLLLYVCDSNMYGLTLYTKWPKKSAPYFARLNFVKCWPSFQTFFSLSESGEYFYTEE